MYKLVVYLLLVLMLITSKSMAQQTWGLCVGIAEYKPHELSLKWSDKDASEFSTFLRYGLKLPESNYRIVRNREATREKILESLGWLSMVAGPIDRVYIFYSGHGKPDSPFLPYDSKNPLSLEQIKKALRKIDAREVIVFADACYSGKLAGKGVKAVIEHEQVTGLSKSVVDEMGKAKTGVVIMTSATGIQEAFEVEGQKNGLFTYYLMSALMDEELQHRIDQNCNGSLSLDELYAYVSQAVGSKTAQQPQISDIKKAQEIVLLHITSPTPAPTTAPVSAPVFHLQQASSIQDLALASEWIRIAADKALSLSRELERLGPKRKSYKIAEEIGSPTAEKIQEQIDDIRQNIDELFREYAETFAKLKKVDKAVRDEAFGLYRQEVIQAGETGQRNIQELIQSHFQHFLKQGEQREQWKRDFENFW